MHEVSRPDCKDMQQDLRKPRPSPGYYDYMLGPVPFLHTAQTQADKSDKHKVHASKHGSSRKSITRSVLGNQVPGTSFTQALLENKTAKAHKTLLQQPEPEHAEVSPMPSPSKPKKKSLTACIRESNAGMQTDSDTDSARSSTKTRTGRSKSKSKKNHKKSTKTDSKNSDTEHKAAKKKPDRTKTRRQGSGRRKAHTVAASLLSSSEQDSELESAKAG